MRTELTFDEDIDESGSYALSTSIASDEPDLDVALADAVSEGDIERVKQLLKQGASPYELTDFVDELGYASPIHIAAFYGHDDCVRLLLGVARADDEIECYSSAYDECGLTPFAEALARHHDTVVQVFIDENAMGPDEAFRDDYYSDATPFIVIPPNASWAHIAYLLKSDPLMAYCLMSDDVDINATTHWDVYLNSDDLPLESTSVLTPLGGTVLHMVCADGEIDLLNSLLTSQYIEIDQEDAYGRSPIFYSVLRGENDQVLALLNAGVDLFVRDSYKYTPLYYAVMSNNVDCAMMMVDHVIATTPIHTAIHLLNSTYDAGKTLLHLCYEKACPSDRSNSDDSSDEREHSSSLYNTDESMDESTDDMEYSEDPSLELFAYLIAQPQVDLNVKDNYGRTVYQIAALLKDKKALKLLQAQDRLQHDLIVQDTSQNKHRQRIIDTYVAEDSDLEPAISAIMSAENSAGIQYSEDSDEGKTAAHHAVSKKRKKIVSTMLRDNKCDLRQRDANGHTVIHQANKQQQNGYSDIMHIFRTAQSQRLDDSTTGGSSSEDLSAEKSVVALPAVSLTESWQTKIEQDCQLLNSQIKQNMPLDSSVADHYCLVHFRGVNFNRQHFSHEDRRAYLEQDLTQRSMHCKFAHNNAGVAIDETVLSAEQTAELDSWDSTARLLWQALSDQSEEIKPWWKKKNFPLFQGLVHALHDRYTNQASKTYQNGVQGDIWGELWEQIKSRLPRISTQYPELQSILPLMVAEGSLFVSTGKTPEHAVKYAVGASLAPVNRDTRGDPRYRPNGKPKYRQIGLVYTMMHTLTEYQQALTADIPRWHQQRYVSIKPNYLNETEVVFIGGIASQHIVDAMIVEFPDFSRPYSSEYHHQQFGLDEDKYAEYKLGFSQTQRPFKIHVDIFKRPYDLRYQEYFSISEGQFDKLNAWHDYLEDSTPEISLATIDEYGSLLKPSLVTSLRGQLRKGQTIEREPLKIKLQEQLKEILLNIFDGSYHQKYQQAFGIDAHQFVQFQKSIEEKGKTVKLANAFRRLHPYRRLKDKLREHLAGFFDQENRQGVEGVISSRLFNQAWKIAQEKGKYLIYMDADGLLKPYLPSSWQIKKQIVKSATTHAPSIIASSVTSVSTTLTSLFGNTQHQGSVSDDEGDEETCVHHHQDKRVRL